MTTAIIGLDRDIAEPLRDAIRSPQNRVYIYDTIPKGRTVEGQVLLEHPSGGSEISPDFIYYYSYFPDALPFRKALAISDVPVWPDIRKTILHDDKDLSLIQCLNVRSPPRKVPRGYVLEGTAGPGVYKWGNSHCGDNKVRVGAGEIHTACQPCLVEPFIEGESYRSFHLSVGDHKIARLERWAIHYESEDWRKNVNPTRKTVYHYSDVHRVEDRQHIQSVMRAGAWLCGDLRLQVAGIDFILPSDGSDPVLLEVNCYPEIIEEAKPLFIKQAVREYKKQ